MEEPELPEDYYYERLHAKQPPGIRPLTILFIVLFVVASALAAAGWGFYVVVKADDRMKLVGASTDLLTEVMKKLASVSNDTAFKKKLSVFTSVRDLFSALANLHSIFGQWERFCAPSSNSTFQQTPTNVSANYTSSCGKYGMLYPLVDPFLRDAVSIEAFMAAVSNVVTALMRLDNAIVADP